MAATGAIMMLGSHRQRDGTGMNDRSRLSPSTFYRGPAVLGAFYATDITLCPRKSFISHFHFFLLSSAVFLNLTSKIILNSRTP